jgi:dephospho-CoA kinase
MIVVGLTGGMGSGKTFVAHIFNKKGIPVYNSDSRAKELMVSDPYIISQLKQQFGANVIQNKILNKKQIAEHIFKNKELLHWINNLVHPIVSKDFNKWSDSQNNTPFVIKEAAILIESGAHKLCNQIIVVSAPESLRIERVMTRDKLSFEQVQARLNNQMNENERKKYANYIINNDGLQSLDKQVERIYNDLINLKN